MTFSAINRPIKCTCILLHLCFTLVSRNLSGAETAFDCHVTNELPGSERCREYIVSPLPAPVSIKAVTCLPDSTATEDQAYFIYTSSPDWVAWLCRSSNRQKTSQQSESHALHITIAEKQSTMVDDDRSLISGGYHNDFFDGRRPGKPGTPGMIPFLLGTISAGIQPVGTMSFIFDLELPDSDNRSPVIFHQSTVSDGSNILVLISETQQRIYRRAYQMGSWYLASQINVETFISYDAIPDNFIEEDKLVRALVAAFGWIGKNDNTLINQEPDKKIKAAGRNKGTGKGKGSDKSSGKSTKRNTSTSNSRGFDDSPAPSQRHPQDQGSGGEGDDNQDLDQDSLMSDPDFNKQFVSDALIVYKMLSEDQIHQSLIYLQSETYLGTHEETSTEPPLELILTIPKFAMHWLKIIHDLFPDNSSLKSVYSTERMKLLLSFDFYTIHNDGCTNSYSITGRFGLLRHAPLSNRFVLDLCANHPLLQEKEFALKVFSELKAKLNEAEQGGWFYFVMYALNSFSNSFENNNEQEISSWLAILASVLLELQEDHLNNLIAVGLSRDHRQEVGRQIITMQGVDEEVEQAKGDYKQLAIRAIKRKRQLQCELDREKMRSEKYRKTESPPRCSICLESYKLPMVIKCGHIFCKGCLEKDQKPRASAGQGSDSEDGFQTPKRYICPCCKLQYRTRNAFRVFF